MLKISNTYTFWRTVTVTNPDGTKSDIKVQFSYDPKASKQAMDDIRNSLYQDVDDTAMAFAKQSVIGWEGITDANGDTIPFSVHMLESILNTPWIAHAIGAELITAISGNPPLGN